MLSKMGVFMLGVVVLSASAPREKSRNLQRTSKKAIINTHFISVSVTIFLQMVHILFHNGKTFCQKKFATKLIREKVFFFFKNNKNNKTKRLKRTIDEWFGKDFGKN